jgi:predicted ester cyclase
VPRFTLLVNVALAAHTEVPMSTEENKVTARQLTEEVFSRGNLAALERFFEPDAQTSGSIVGTRSEGLHAIEQSMRLFLAAFSDWQVRIDALVAEAEDVMMRWTAGGIQTGVLEGTAATEVLQKNAYYRRLARLAPTGRRVSITGVVHLRFRGGKIASLWLLVDTLELIRQVGILPSAGEMR